VIREDVESDQIVDMLSGSKTYAIALTVINKIDLVDDKFLKDLKTKIKSEYITVSAESNKNLDVLKDMIYEKLRFMRIYLRPKGGETDFKEPLIAKEGSTILDICNKLHRNMKKQFRYGLVWGKSVKFGGQRVGINHVLVDEDVLTIIKTRGL
jgi:ribosome-interacting GTPase 1